MPVSQNTSAYIIHCIGLHRQILHLSFQAEKSLDFTGCIGDVRTSQVAMGMLVTSQPGFHSDFNKYHPASPFPCYL